jgi:hypothetical protein
MEVETLQETVSARNRRGRERKVNVLDYANNRDDGDDGDTVADPEDGEGNGKVDKDRYHLEEENLEEIVDGLRPSEDAKELSRPPLRVVAQRERHDLVERHHAHLALAECFDG